IGYGLIYQTEVLLPSGLVSVLWGVFPLLMALLSHYFLPGEELNRKHVFGFALGFTGVVLLFLTDVRGFGEAALASAALLLLSPLFTAFSTLMIKRHGSGCNSLVLSRNSMALGSLCLLGWGWLTEGGEPLRWTGNAIFSIVYLSIMGSCVTFGLYFWLMRHCRASRLSLIAFVTPCIALIFGQVLGDEPVTWYTLLGTTLILLGIGLGIGRAR
ncbi:MAG: DMT family transporter, partial [Planctomycetota bacterium]